MFKRPHDAAPCSDAADRFEDLLRARRSVRKFANLPVTLDQVVRLLWAAQGNVAATGFRTVPSAGALYPLAVYAVAGHIEGLEQGVYKYVPRDNSLSPIHRGDSRSALCVAALGQEWVRHAPALLVFAADYSHTALRYHDRAERYVHMEAGHAAQNVYLLATALGLATVAVGAFDDGQAAHALGLPPNEHPLYILPIGVPCGPA